MSGIYNQSAFYVTKINFLNFQIKAIMDALLRVTYLHFSVLKMFLVLK